jgi:proline iminopeptidase
MKAKIRGTEIYFDIAGMQLAPKDGDFVERPVIFLLHGGPGGDHLRYKQYALELQEMAQLVFIDHRGCGRSKKTKMSDYTLENNVEDIEALRKHLGLEKICILGTSYGGVVAQAYAVRYPKNVDKLILVVTAPSFHFLTEAKKALKSRGTAKQIAAAEDLWKGTFKNQKHAEDFFKIMENMYSVKAKKKPAKKPKIKTLWSHEALNKGFSDVLRKLDLTPQLKKIKCPTLILAGDQDWICSANQSKIIAKHIPKSQLKIFKNCGHAMGVDAKQGFHKAVKGFLKK